MPASQVREDRAGVRSLGERERRARSNELCPVMESSLKPPADAGYGDARALHADAIQFIEKTDSVSGSRGG